MPETPKTDRTKTIDPGPSPSEKAALAKVKELEAQLSQERTEKRKARDDEPGRANAQPPPKAST